MLINRLTNHVLGRIEMTNAQIRAADILLRKVCPDLAVTTLQNADGSNVTFTRILYAELPRQDAPVQVLPETVPTPDIEGTGRWH